MYLLLYKTSNYEKYFVIQNKKFDLFIETKKQASMNIVIFVRNESK